MPNSIEIFENTLLKQIIRQGVDSDRQAITLDSGELGFSNDTNRLFVGDGSTLGGILVGNVFKGSAVNVTSLAPAEIGDMAYDSDNKVLYVLESNTGSVIGDWLSIGGVYSASDGSIVISSDNQLSVGVLSSGSLSPDLLNDPLYFDGSGRISLSGTVPVDYIVPKTGSTVTLHDSLSVNGSIYNFPATTGAVGEFLQVTNVASNSMDLEFNSISASTISNNTITVTGLLTSTANGVDSTGTAVNPLTADIVIGTSNALSSTNHYIRYDGALDIELFTTGLSAVRTGKGKYTFNYPTLPTYYPYVNVSIIGNASKGYQASVMATSDTSCNVEVTAFNNLFLYSDAEISLKIET